ncbi:MAG: hypothetical protein R2771_05450 [Saprospiraceae bacterium]
MYLVWTGGLEYWWEDAFTPTEVQSWKAKYDIVKANPFNFNCN